LNGFLGAADALLARVHPEDREQFMRLLEQVRQGTEPCRLDHRILAPDGTCRVVHTQDRSVQDGCEVPRYVVGTIQDITERKRVEEALRRSEERYALAARGANDGLWDWDLRTDRIYYSPRWKAMLGYGEAQIGDDPSEWLGRIHPDDLSQMRSALSNHRDGATVHFESEHRVRHKDGGYRWMLCRGLAARDSRGEAYRMAGSQSDITERRWAEDQLLHDAFHDGLTGLANRALFLERLAHTLRFAARRRDYVFAVVFLDLDRFKVINDSLGHACGDQLLIEISKRLQRGMRASDTVARLGGDEFTLLLDDVKDVATVIRFVERLHQELQQPFHIEEHEVVTTASIGITLSTTGYDRPEDMLRDADTAMYRAKTLGKARYEVFDADMHREAAALLEVETELRRAIKHREFRLHYQPIMALGNDSIQGFEALLRWYHPRRGVLEPEAFLAVAEETGLMLPIGRWVLREAAYQMLAWQEQWPQARTWFVAVNLGSKEFARPDLLTQIDRVLAETRLDPRSLKIEITEKVLIDNASAALARLQALRERGIALAIDDFGTGYSSLSYLHRFPFNTVKIDRSFVGGLEVRKDAAQIIEAIVPSRTTWASTWWQRAARRRGKRSSYGHYAVSAPRAMSMPSR
jgi:diguanylate cyclase (GGDEF)-like protein/PAS domain S-box-containing protein